MSGCTRIASRELFQGILIRHGRGDVGRSARISSREFIQSVLIRHRCGDMSGCAGIVDW